MVQLCTYIFHEMRVDRHERLGFMRMSG